MRSIFPADRWLSEKENETKGEYWRQKKKKSSGEREQEAADAV